MMGSGLSSLARYDMLRMIFRVDGPHLRTRERVEDVCNPISFLSRRLVSREIQQTSTKPTYTIAAISSTEGRSEMIIVADLCLVHFLYLLGFGDDVRMTRLADFVKTSHGWRT